MNEQPEDVEAEYASLNATEKRIVGQFEEAGLSRREALDKLYEDLNDAAEEDGYDGA